MRRVLTTYQWHTGKLRKPVRIAVLSDLHDKGYEDIWSMIEGADCLLVPGDVVNRYRQSFSKGLAFLNQAAERLPTFFSVGNHEVRLENPETMLNALARSKVTVLFNRFTRFGELWIGGWYRPKALKMPDIIDEFERVQGCKILMCHRPEDYMKELRGREIDLILAGHAHGGQIRIGGQGIYAPGQGIFPKYTKGVVDGRMLVSAGASNPVPVPRWGNPCEVVHIALD